MDRKKVIAEIDCKNGKTINGFSEDIVETGVYLDRCQADGILLVDKTPSSDAQEAALINLIKNMTSVMDIPVFVVQTYNRFEDAKKILYAGAASAVMPLEDERAEAAIIEAAERFGNKIGLYIDESSTVTKDVLGQVSKAGVTCVYTDKSGFRKYEAYFKDYNMQVIIADSFNSGEDMVAVMDGPDILGIADNHLLPKGAIDVMAFKHLLKDKGVKVSVFESKLPFSSFKTDDNGLVPTVVQDYKTGKVLMLAYMNQESFDETIRSGRMTYYSRSRQELWKKGETSGHYQYVKSLDIDCDKDTILAKVAQVGAACHTGSETCFYTNLAKREYNQTNPFTIFEEIMATIEERKVNPKEGSYTNYLFDKGVDKILKKVGEEATEIVIAAKNPDSDELKYEICDFLYHMMVLMANENIGWREIVEELATRH